MLSVLAILALTAIVWTAVCFQRGGLVVAGLLVLLAGICFGPAFFHLGPISLERLLWAALMGYYLVARAAGATANRPLTRVDLALGLLYLAVVANALAFGIRHEGFHPASQLAFYHLLPLGMYWVARQAEYSRRTVLGTLAALAVFGTYLSATAIAEVSGLSWAVYPSYIAAPEDTEFLGRARGPLRNPAGSGMLQGICLAATALLWPSAGRRGRLLLVCVGLVMLAGVYSTLTRSVWLGAGAGLFVIGFLAMPRRTRLPAVAMCVLLVGMLGLTQWERLLTFKRDKHQTAADTADSAALRPILAAIAWQMFEDRPLAGCGYGHYIEEHEQYLHKRPWGLALDAGGPYIQHNILMAYLVETGLVGMGLFAIVLALWVSDAWLVWRRADAPPWMRQYGLLFLALFANYFVNGMFHDVTLIPMVNMVVYFLAGMLVAIRQEAYGMEAATAPTAAKLAAAPA